MSSKVKVKKSGVKVQVRAERRGRTSTSVISAKNQVTVPVEILRKVGIKQGDLVEFMVNSDGAIEIQIARAESEGERLIRILQGALSGTMTQEDLQKLRDQDERSWH